MNCLRLYNEYYTYRVNGIIPGAGRTRCADIILLRQNLHADRNNLHKTMIRPVSEAIRARYEEDS